MDKSYFLRSVLETNKDKKSFLGLALCLMLACTQAWAVDLGIEDDADYDKLLTALHATEYVRNDYILANTPKPRVYASLAALMAYSERNPYASGIQLEKFLEEFDLAVRNFARTDADLNDPCDANLQAACDPNLIEAATFLSALRLTIVSGSIFAGTDTEVGEQALMLLGVTIPDPDGFESINRRMVDYEMALARPLQYRNEIFDLLVAGFFGRDMAGNERSALPAILDNYFKSEGYDPELGIESVRPDRANINEGLDLMPDSFAAYSSTISEGTSQNDDLRNQIGVLLESIRDQINSIVGVDCTDGDIFDCNAVDGNLDNAVANAPGFAESVDPAFITDAFIQQVLAERRADLQATAKARAAASAATYLMLQSQDDAIGDYAGYTREYGQISLETSSFASDFKAELQIAGSIFGATLGVAVRDPTAVIGGLASVANLGLGLASDSPSDQTLQQLSQLRGQVKQMQREMNTRFDRIDKKLNIMFGTITNGLDQINYQLGVVDENVEMLVEDMAAAQSQLRRIETALYDVAKAILTTELTVETDLVLDYFDSTGANLNYAGTTSFINATSALFSFATTTAIDPTFSGVRSKPDENEPGNLLTDASTSLTDDIVLSRLLNPLAVLPGYLSDYDGPSELASSSIPGIEPWSQAGSAYAQIGRENPWYFRSLYGVEVQNHLEKGASKPNLDQIILKGEEVVSFVEAIRETDKAGEFTSATGSSLFDALIENYRTAVNAFQDQIDAQRTPANLSPNITAPCVFSISLDFGVENPKCIAGGTTEQKTVDLWSSNRQEEVIKNLIGFRLAGNGVSQGGWLFKPGLSSQQGQAVLQFLPQECDAPSFCGLGWNTFTDGSAESNYWLRVWYFNQEANDVSRENLTPRYSVISSGFTQIDFWIGGINQRDAFPIWKTIVVQLNQNGAPIFPNDSFPIIQDTWDSPPFTNDSFRMDVIKFLLAPTSKTYKNTIDEQNSLMTVANFRPRNPLGADDVLPGWYGALSKYRKLFHSHILNELADTQSELTEAAKEVDDAVALLNAYVTIGMPKELAQSQVLRSALRLPGGDDSVTSDMRLASMVAMVLDIDNQDKTDDFADPNFNINKVMDILNSRADIVAEEIKLGLQRPVFAPDYIGLVLAELRHLRTTAFDLAVDDTYLIGINGMLAVDAIPDPKHNSQEGENAGRYCSDPRYITGLLGNDAKQGCSAVTIDTAFTPELGYIAPNKGSVTINEDGSFTYVANSGFNSNDSFTYRAKAIVNGKVIYSNTATVVITSEIVQSGELIFADGLEGGTP